MKGAGIERVWRKVHKSSFAVITVRDAIATMAMASLASQTCGVSLGVSHGHAEWKVGWLAADKDSASPPHNTQINLTFKS